MGKFHYMGIVPRAYLKYSVLIPLPSCSLKEITSYIMPFKTNYTFNFPCFLLYSY